VAGRHVAGWDVGGVNTKVAHVERGQIASVCGRPFELQRAADRLVALLRELASEAGCPAGSADVLHAVTMTAELSQMFRTKREGVAFVLDAIETAFPASPIRVFAVDGRFLAPADARVEPLAVAAANWSATAHLVALDHPDSLLIDVGTTTTDIIPIVGGRVVARGQTDPGRLASGELVYTGALRTPAEAIASEIPLRGETVGVAAEGFALAGDAHLWRGDLAAADYTVATPDGRPATKEFAGERLARVICADREMLDEAAISLIAEALTSAQVQRIAAAIRGVIGRHPTLDVAVTTGLGAFLAAAAARAAGLKVVPLAAELGEAAARFAPAAAVALLAAREQPVITFDEPHGVLREPHGSFGHAHDVPSESAGVLSEPKGVFSQPRDVIYGSTSTFREAKDAFSYPRNTCGEQKDISSDEKRRARPENRVPSLDPRTASPEPRAPSREPRVESPEPRVDVVIKVGGSLLAQPECLDRVLAIVGSASKNQRLVIVPGGGAFADAVRKADSAIRLSDGAAHWMAVLAMDQYAHLLADRVRGGLVATNVEEIASVLRAGRVPVLAPSRWLRDADPLPHSWDVTSDSIAAWVAGALGARQLVLVKPTDASGSDVVDPYFSRALPQHVSSRIIAVDQSAEIRRALNAS
jgi:probable H4MPT-linked C1 transfer pathway protein